MSPISGSGKLGADVVGLNKGAGETWGVGYDGSGSSGDDARGDSGFDGSVGAMLAVSSESGSAKCSRKLCVSLISFDSS